MYLGPGAARRVAMRCCYHTTPGGAVAERFLSLKGEERYMLLCVCRARHVRTHARTNSVRGLVVLVN